MAEFFQFSTAERLDALNAVADIAAHAPQELHRFDAILDDMRQNSDF